MKKKGFFWLIALLAIFILPLLLLNNNRFQQKLLQHYLKVLALEYDLEPRFDSFRFHIDKNIFIQFGGLALSDSLGQTFLTADRLDLSLRTLPLLLNRQVNATELRLIRANVQLYRLYEDSPLNLEYLKQLFKSDKQLFRSFQVSSLILKDCSFSYDLITAPEKTSFDVNHIKIQDLNAKLFMHIPQDGPLELVLESLCLDEHSGFILEDLSLNALLTEHNIIVDQVSLLLPGSCFEVDSIKLSYQGNLGSGLDSLFLSAPVNVMLALNFSDIGAFLPENVHLEDSKAQVDFSVSGGEEKLILSELRFQMDSVMYFDGNIDIFHIRNETRFRLLSTVNFLHIQPEARNLLQNVFSINDSIFPAVVNKFGSLDFCGVFDLSPHQWLLEGDLIADPGILATKAIVNYTATDKIYDFNLNVSSDSYALNDLFDTTIKLGNSAFEFIMNGKKVGTDPIIANLDAKFNSLNLNEYNYNNIFLNAYFNGHGYYNGRLSSRDQHCLLDMSVSLNDMGDDATINCTISADHIDLHELNWMQGEDASTLSFDLHAELKGNNLNQLRGRLNIDSVRFENNEAIFEMDHFYALTGDNQGERYLLLRSGLLDGWIYGKIELQTLIEDIKNRTLVRYFPDVFPGNYVIDNTENNFDFKFLLSDTRILSKALDLPLSIPSSLSLEGFFRKESNQFSVNIKSDEIRFDGFNIKSPNMVLENPEDSLQWSFDGDLIQNDSMMIHVDFQAQALNNNVNWHTNWRTDSGELYSINLYNSLRFERNNDNSALSIYSEIKPSEIILRDSIWTMEPSDLQWDGHKLKVNDFLLHHRNQYVKLEGILSNNNDDVFWIDLNKVNLDYIFELLPKKEGSISLGGNISGAAQIINLFEEPKLNASLTAEGFSLNKSVLGDLNFNSSWNESIGGIEVNGILFDQDRQTAKARGGFFPTSDSIYLWIDAQQVRLSFLNGFFGSILENFDGYGSGYVEIAGTFKDNRVGISSDCYIENGVFGVDLLNCNYYFSDSLHLTPFGIFFKNINVSDVEGNRATINGAIRHEYFNNISLDLNMQTNHLKVIDIEPSYAEQFYGRVYATGSALFDGPVEDIQIDINMRTDERSNFAMTLLEESDVSDYSFIEFVVRDTVRDSIKSREKRILTSGLPITEPPVSRINLNLQIEVTPSAEVILVTNPTTGDEIRGRGAGSIRVVYDNTGDLELYGRYTLESGSYQFIIQDLLRRDFSIMQGSTLNFSGDPLSAEMNINAIYSVINVSLSDLLDEAEIASLNLNRSSIPVNCTLTLSGELQHPNIQLGLDFPSADEELRRRVMNVINTDEMLNRQIVYLMLLNRFAAADNTLTQNNTNVNAVVGATLSSLSSQLNNMIYQALGSSFLSFDFNYRYDDLVAQGLGEWQLAMSSQLLDNRLIINGNIGSREDLVNNNTQFIGDFDLEYKFSQSGRWRLKMFNRSNDSRYFKSAMTTQGVGMGYRESFNNLLELRQLFAERIAAQIIKSLKESDLKK